MRETSHPSGRSTWTEDHAEKYCSECDLIFAGFHDCAEYQDYLTDMEQEEHLWGR